MEHSIQVQIFVFYSLESTGLWSDGRIEGSSSLVEYPAAEWAQ